MQKISFPNRRVWITGASSGIGRFLALELASQGARLALSGRNRKALENLAEDCGKDCLILDFSVDDKQANKEAARKIEQAWGGLDTAILNAGICEYLDDAEQLDPALFEKTFRINYLGMLNGAAAALPLLKRSDSAQLAAMASTAAYLPLPRAEAYGASKAAIRYSFHALSGRLRHKGIAVSVICPGFVRTPLTDQNDFPMPMRVEPDKAARIIRRGLERRKTEIAFPLLFCLIMKSIAILPMPLQVRLLGRML